MADEVLGGGVAQVPLELLGGPGEAPEGRIEGGGLEVQAASALGL